MNSNSLASSVSAISQHHISFSNLPSPPTGKKQVLRSYSREQFDTVMKFLLQEFVPARKGETHKPCCCITDVAAKTKISVRTLFNYVSALTKNDKYNPYDSYQKSQRAMSKALEEELVRKIENDYLIPGNYFNNRVLKLVALAMWEEARPEDRLRKTFKASSGWCRNFRKRHGYVWRRVRLAKRPKISEKTKEIERRFLEKVKELRLKLAREGLLHTLCNMDETSWRLLYAGDLTWGKKGAETVKIRVNHNIKEAITALATITADCRKLPMYMIAKGKTARAENNQIGGIRGYDYATDHSPSGWSTKETMINYLKFFRNYMNQHFGTERQRLYLILDVYKSHCDQRVKECCEENNIELIYIPAGCTDAYQPLDIKVFGALKSKARGKWYATYCSNPNERLTKKQAARTLLQCWDELSQNSIEGGWEQYINLLREEEEDDIAVENMNQRTDLELNEIVSRGMQRLRSNNQQEVGQIFAGTITVPIDSNRGSTEEDQTEEDEEAYYNSEEEEDYEEEEYEEDEYDIDESVLFEDNLNETTNNNNPPILPNNIPNDNSDASESSTTYTLIETLDPQFTGSVKLKERLDNEIVKKQSREADSRIFGTKRTSYQTVGIINPANYCAFNSAIQILNLMGAEDIMKQPGNKDEVSYYNAVFIVLNRLIHAADTIDPHEILLDDAKANSKSEQFVKHITDLINNDTREPMLYIRSVMKDRLNFKYNNQTVDAVVVDEWSSFEELCKFIQPETLQNFLIFEFPVNEVYYEFPMQFILEKKLSEDHLCRKLCILKAISVNLMSTPIEGHHFVTYLREEVEDSFIYINDHRMRRSNIQATHLRRPRIALYFVINLN